jgi:serine/threonine protein kinase
MSKQWGRWKNLEALPESGQSHVFKVEDRETNLLGALKRLKSVRKRDRVERFRNEVTAAKRLSHLNIASLIDADLECDGPYAVFEWVEGGSLGDISEEALAAVPLVIRLDWWYDVDYDLGFSYCV